MEQLTRYLDFLNRDPMLRPVRVFCGPGDQAQAGSWPLTGIGCVVVDYDDLRGIESNDLKLF
ncbi:MAG: hypothetical protein Ct9H300mP12_02060 [Acidimicrobiales bacterium]|nr:MAG: hypothetical protein Ct9H300mP12_02060 [Acidimicrobiales bacterium]